MARKQQHVVPHGDRWAVRGSSHEQVSSIHSTQSEAIQAGRRAAINQRGELFIHGRNGQIRERSTYGIDPYPPKG